MLYRANGWRLAGWLAMAVLAVASTSGSGAGGEEFTLHAFKKVTLTDKFFSEGMYYGDFNHDGKMDVVAGPYWYAGPDFASRHEFMKAQEFRPEHYSNAFLMFAYDFSGDGWDDILVVGWPGKEVYWFENPKQADGMWTQHLVHPNVDNESPGFADITGDKKPELLFHTGGQLGYAALDSSQPSRPWRFTPVSTPSGWGKYQHGYGYGDVNGDGRADLMLREGWWEQSSAADPVQPWVKHPFNFGDGGAQMHVYDVDGDNDGDVITSLQAHGYGLVWFENHRDDKDQITFRQHTITGSKPEENKYGVKFSQPHAIDLVDIDGDGLKDIVTGKRFWAHGSKGDAEPNAPAVLYWFRLTRTAEGVEYVPYLVDSNSGVGTQVIAHDVSGDGRPDILVGNKKGHFVFIQESRKVSKEEWEEQQPQPLAAEK